MYNSKESRQDLKVQPVKQQKVYSNNEQISLRANDERFKDWKFNTGKLETKAHPTIHKGPRPFL